LRRTLTDVEHVLLAAVLERAIVVRGRDAERATGKLPPRAAQRRCRKRELAVAAAEEAAELRAGAEQVEVDVAHPRERQWL
jgi:hypothetical protein